MHGDFETVSQGQQLAADAQCTLPDAGSSIGCLHQALWYPNILSLQVAILSEGRSVYFGRPEGVLPWFHGRLGYPLASSASSMSVSDWIIDLVSLPGSG